MCACPLVLVSIGFVAVTLGSSFGWSSAFGAAGAVRSGTVCSLQPNGSGALGLRPVSELEKYPHTSIANHNS